MHFIQLAGVGYSYGGPASVFQDISLQLDVGWTGLVGENGAGKSTLLSLLARTLRPDVGHIHYVPADANVVLCPQRVEHDDPNVRALATRNDGDAQRWRAIFALKSAQLTRWPSLSPGERKRWQVGGALAREPAVLLLDEPTNHMDDNACDALSTELKRFRGIGVLVSHDRTLLDTLTASTVRLTHGRAAQYPAPYTRACTLWQAELDHAREQRTLAQQRSRKVKYQLNEAARKHAAAEHSMAGSRRDPRDHDARSSGAKARRARAEARLAKSVSRLRTADQRTRSAIPEVQVERQLGRSIFVDFVPAPRKTLLSLHTNELYAGDALLFRDVRLQVARRDRIRLIGPNGTGKSTLLSALLARSANSPEQLLYLPQDTRAEDAAELLRQVRGLNRITLGRVLSLVAALGSDPKRLLNSALPSPGETRKLQLALGMGCLAWALVLDEPENHLDLPTIERLHQALVEYPGALVLVTHDDEFAKGLTNCSWLVQANRVELR